MLDPVISLISRVWKFSVFMGGFFFLGHFKFHVLPFLLTSSYICKHKNPSCIYLKGPLCKACILFPLFLNIKRMLHTLLTSFATCSGVWCISAVTRISIHICKASPCYSMYCPPSLPPLSACVCKHLLMFPASVGLQSLICIPLSPCECLQASLTYTHGRKNACGLYLQT